ncbi:hypothetical protein [Nocardia stercoris]|nr:hypothetical protein [Nocardia stercoris]
MSSMEVEGGGSTVMRRQSRRRSLAALSVLPLAVTLGCAERAHPQPTTPWHLPVAGTPVTGALGHRVGTRPLRAAHPGTLAGSGIGSIVDLTAPNPLRPYPSGVERPAPHRPAAPPLGAGLRTATPTVHAVGGTIGSREHSLSR